MAIVVRRRKDGTERFQAVYRNVDGRQSSAGVWGTRKAAEKAYLKAKVQVNDGIDPTKILPEVEVFPTTGALTAGMWADEWLPRHKLTAHGRKSYTSIMNRYIMPYWKTVPLEGIRTYDVQTWFEKLEIDGVTWDVRKHVKCVLSAMFTAAVKRDKMAFNPCHGTDVGERPWKPQRQVLSPDEYEEFRKHIPEWYQLYTDFIIEHGGLRIEEATGLQDVDIDPAGQIYIRCTLNELWGPHRWAYKQETKTRKPRTIKVEPEMCARLLARARPCRCGGCGSKGSYVFLNEDGTHIGQHTFRKWVWRPALAAIGKADSGITPKDMRHIHATWLKNVAELDWEVVRDRLGHSSIVTTQIYVGEVKKNEDKALEGMARVRKQR